MLKYLTQIRHRMAIVLAVLVTAFSAAPAYANWTLTDTERADFLEYYAPIIFKRGNGNGDDYGKDWITNFDFDRDYVFSDNKEEWRDIRFYIDAANAGPNATYEAWRLRPTLYTSMIEYMDNGQKDLVLFYHVYHGLDKDAANNTQLHDWERIEIHIGNISNVGQPGYGEHFKFAVVTQHSRSVREYPSGGKFKTMNTSTGKHLMIFQAEWSRKVGGIHGQELRFVEDSWGTISSDMNQNDEAEVEINGTSNDKNVHYAFIPDGSSGAVSAFNAQELNYYTAPSLTSYFDNGDTADWNEVPRIKYELQDIADINPTHWSGSNYQPHWTTAKSESINIVSPFQNRVGTTISGLQTFYMKSFDPEGKDTRSGYMAKPWFWGTYEIRDVCGSNTCTSKAKEFDENSYASTRTDTNGNTRSSASGDAPSPNSYWNQHDYFVHSGIKDSRDGYEHGQWLTQGWHLAANGGFDGRWTSLFDDDVDAEPTPPPLVTSASVSQPSCSEYGTGYSSASGGVAPYTHVWRRYNSVVKTQTGTNSNYLLDMYIPYSVTVTDAIGNTTTRNLQYTQQCGSGQHQF